MSNSMETDICSVVSNKIFISEISDNQFESKKKKTDLSNTELDLRLSRR
jgi:hypothetical protein